MMSILTLVIIPLIIALITLLLEYWLIQPLREKKAKSRLINNIQEVPPQQYLQSNNRILRLPSKNIAVITTVDTRIFDLSDFPESVDFKGLIPLLVDIFNLEKNLKNSYVVSTYYLYANWKRTKHDVSVSQSISENPVLVLSSYPCFELLQASDMLQDGLITSTLHKPLSDSREARLEYDYRSVLDLDRLSNKVKLISVKNDKTLYLLSFQCKSVKDVTDTGEILFNDQCEVEITIPAGYPPKARDSWDHVPRIRVTTKVLHPNIHKDGYVGIGDWIDAPENKLSLATMCLMTIEMLEYHWFDLGSPFNMYAVKKFNYLKPIIPLDSSNLKGL